MTVTKITAGTTVRPSAVGDIARGETYANTNSSLELCESVPRDRFQRKLEPPTATQRSTFRNKLLSLSRLCRGEEAKALRSLANNKPIMVKNPHQFITKLFELVRFTEPQVNLLRHKERYTMTHSKRVAEYAKLIGQQYGLGHLRLQSLGDAGLLHDIGKLGVPSCVLYEEGFFSPKKIVKVQQHVVYSRMMLDNLAACNPSVGRYLDQVRRDTYEHHEAVDGTGYPSRHKGDKIPTGAKLLAVVDVFDALTSMRPYKVRYSFYRVVEILQNKSGKHLDPKALEAFWKCGLHDIATILSTDVRRDHVAKNDIAQALAQIPRNVTLNDYIEILSKIKASPQHLTEEEKQIDKAFQKLYHYSPVAE